VGVEDLTSAIEATRGAQLMQAWLNSGTVDPDEVDKALEIARAEQRLLLDLRRHLGNVTESRSVSE
jgi:hypothetical protein